MDVFDTDGSGSLCATEIRAALRDLGLGPAKTENDELDVANPDAGDSTIGLQELVKRVARKSLEKSFALETASTKYTPPKPIRNNPIRY